MCELVRPSEPIAFISNFMLINKGTWKTMEDILKDPPKYNEVENMMGSGEYSGEEHNEEGGEEQEHEEEK